MRRLLIILAVAVLFALCSSCARSTGGMKDGYYTAEGTDYNAHGWKDYMTIYVSGGKILTVEYDAYNASGFVRSWDINYMRRMSLQTGTYPNEFTREYSIALLADRLDAISGATEAYKAFKLLADAAIAQAKAGDSKVALVDLIQANTVTEG